MRRIGGVQRPAGIAQLACQAGEETLLLDADPAALERAQASIEAGVAKAAAKGRADAGAAQRLRVVTSVADLAGCAVVIEAIPEDLALKQSVFGEIADVVGDGCVLATNTSSLPVTQVAAGLPAPERIVGLHFFNPAPVMKLVEMLSASDPAKLEEYRRACEALVAEYLDGNLLRQGYLMTKATKVGP